MRGTLPAAALVLAGLQLHAASLEIQHRARSLRPGELVLVEVQSREPLRGVRAEWLGQTLEFYQLEPRRWQGLAPLDLSIASGRHTLLINATTTNGDLLQRRYPVTVSPRRFATRRITVPPEFARPPDEVRPRIEKEREAVEAILGRAPGGRLWTEPFVVPVPGRPTSPFGRRTILNGQMRGQHAGTDFEADVGTPVVAPNGGTVVLAADHYLSGRTVIIDHGLGMYSFLAHLSELGVSAGDTVERGQRIALAGATGRVTGPHLHWAMRVAGARVDPLSVVAVLRDSPGPRSPP